MSIRETLAKSIFDQTDESTTVPLSIRLPNHLNNELEELTLTLDKSKTFLLLEFIKAGIIETNKLLEEKAMYPKIEKQRDPDDFTKRKKFMLNTNFNNVADVKFNISSINSEYASKVAIDGMFMNKLLIIPNNMKFNHLLTKIVPTKSILFVNSLIQERKEE